VLDDATGRACCRCCCAAAAAALTAAAAAAAAASVVAARFWIIKQATRTRAPSQFANAARSQRWRKTKNNKK